MVTYQRPLDALNNAKGTKVIVELKNGKKFTGILETFDIHINLVLSEAEEVKEEGNEKVGVLFLRGDTIILVRQVKE